MAQYLGLQKTLLRTFCLQYKNEIGTYCLACRKHTNNIGSRTVTMTNKVIRDKSRCAQCLSDKSRFMKQKLNKKRGLVIYKTNMLTYCLVCKKI